MGGLDVVVFVVFFFGFGFVGVLVGGDVNIY